MAILQVVPDISVVHSQPPAMVTSLCRIWVEFDIESDNWEFLKKERYNRLQYGSILRM